MYVCKIAKIIAYQESGKENDFLVALSLLTLSLKVPLERKEKQKFQT